MRFESQTTYIWQLTPDEDAVVREGLRLLLDDPTSGMTARTLLSSRLGRPIATLVDTSAAQPSATVTPIRQVLTPEQETARQEALKKEQERFSRWDKSTVAAAHEGVDDGK